MENNKSFVDQLFASLEEEVDKDPELAALADAAGGKKRWICVLKCGLKYGLCQALGGKDCKADLAKCLAGCIDE